MKRPPQAAPVETVPSRVVLDMDFIFFVDRPNGETQTRQYYAGQVVRDAALIRELLAHDAPLRD